MTGAGDLAPSTSRADWTGVNSIATTAVLDQAVLVVPRHRGDAHFSVAHGGTLPFRGNPATAVRGVRTAHRRLTEAGLYIARAASSVWPSEEPEHRVGRSVAGEVLRVRLHDLRTLPFDLAAVVIEIYDPPWQHPCLRPAGFVPFAGMWHRPRAFAHPPITTRRVPTSVTSDAGAEVSALGACSRRQNTEDSLNMTMRLLTAYTLNTFSNFPPACGAQLFS